MNNIVVIGVVVCYILNYWKKEKDKRRRKRKKEKKEAKQREIL